MSWKVRGPGVAWEKVRWRARTPRLNTKESRQVTVARFWIVVGEPLSQQPSSLDACAAPREGEPVAVRALPGHSPANEPTFRLSPLPFSLSLFKKESVFRVLVWCRLFFGL